MSWLDVILIAIVALGIYKGLSDGIFRQVVSILAIVLAYLLSHEVNGMILPILSRLFSVDHLPHFVPGILSFILLLSFLMFAGRIVGKAIDSTPLGCINHILGGILGGIVSALFLSALISIYEFIDPSHNLIGAELVYRSVVFDPLRELLPTILGLPLFS